MKPICSRSVVGLLLAICALAVALPCAAEPVAGREYKPLATPQTPETPGKLEVLEFFSYACPHCNAFHPLVTQWAKQLPANAVFIRVPVSFGRPEWGQLVRAYYALQATGDLGRLDSALFDAIHKEHQTLFNEATLTAWAVQHGVPEEKFRAAYNSFNVTTRASHADQLSRDYQVQGVPTLVVDGKYEVQGKDHTELLANASQVVDMAIKRK